MSATQASVWCSDTIPRADARRGGRAGILQASGGGRAPGAERRGDHEAPPRLRWQKHAPKLLSDFARRGLSRGALSRKQVSPSVNSYVLRFWYNPLRGKVAR